ncbi:MAG: cytochrome bc complex cytochrome b subunit [candidate division KSB1 bacterium]|nr:cytochrome bc complex cytochrome b subunit [candidate division KSB1 bacterium]
MRVKEWLLERFPIDYQKFVEINEKIFIKEPIPYHMKKWFYAMGATPLIIFAFQVLTGILLTFYYIPSPEMAYESVRHITEDVRFGFLIRGIHRWGSNLMVIALFLHMVRVIFTRAYRPPRELNWIIGVLLLLTTLTFAFTGYSLIYNQLSYWATTVGTNFFKAVPLVGNTVLNFLRGGENVNPNTLTRFFTIHIGLLPPVMTFLIFLHILVLRLHGVAEIEGHEGEGHYPFYPSHFYKVIIATLFLVTVMSALSVVFPPGIGEPATPDQTPIHIKPEWYFYPVYRILKLLPLSVGIYSLVAGLIILTFWPFIDELFKQKMPKVKMNYVFGTLFVGVILILTVWEAMVF